LNSLRPMQVSAGDNWLVVGKILRPHGVKGLVRIHSFARSADTFREAGTVLIKAPSGESKTFSVEAVTPHKGGLLLRLRGMETVEDVEPFRGAEILIPKEGVVREKDEYLWDDLLGMQVYLDTGAYVGVLGRIIETPAHDLYVIEHGNQEVYVPAVHEFVHRIDLKARTMILKGVEDLLELYEV